MAQWFGSETHGSLLTFWPVFLTSHLPFPGHCHRESLTLERYLSWLATHLRQSGVSFGTRWGLGSRPSLGSWNDFFLIDSWRAKPGEGCFCLERPQHFNGELGFAHFLTPYPVLKKWKELGHFQRNGCAGWHISWWAYSWVRALQHTCLNEPGKPVVPQLFWITVKPAFPGGGAGTDRKQLRNICSVFRTL